jgi:hypothetical protein
MSGAARTSLELLPQGSDLRSHGGDGPEVVEILHAAGDRPEAHHRLAFIDADDLWPPGRLTLQLQVLLDDPRLEAVFGTTIQFPSPDLPEEDRRRIYCPPDPAAAELVCAMLVRRTA